VSACAAGLYQVKVMANGSTSTQRLVITAR
jgi:hypothetical protein